MASVVLAGVTVLAAAGCANPPGTDGDLLNQWPAMSAPVGWEPKAGDCTADFNGNLTRNNYKAVGCTTSHRFETVHLGQFTGEAASLGAPPAPASKEYNAAWSECDAKVTEFVGGQWRDGHLWIGISLPTRGAWQGGARWYRCEAGTIDDLQGDPTSRTQSLKGAMASEAELRYGCYAEEGDDKPLKLVDCTTPHNAEYVGSVEIADEYDKLKDNLQTIHTKCRSAVAKYVGVPDDSNVKYRTGTIYSYPASSDWAYGDRSVRCHLYLGKNVSRSLKGTGSSGLPINYA